jgi:hypothetical protein
MTTSIFAIYIMFYGIIWAWATMADDGNDNGAPSPWRIYVDWQAIQTKIGGPSAVGALGACLQRALPHRNATIEDVAWCLKIMGMNDSYVG